MDSRRAFIKKAAALSGGTGLASFFPESIIRAMAIDPAPGSSWEDAEHIVILMQENRSFDHCYGALQGVRGFNDPRAIIKPDNNNVWLQSGAGGETYAPFRLNIKETRVTWLGSLPHSWSNQVDAANNGKHDRWLDVKHSGHKGFEKVPLTMGYYNREDIPFYYALADAFTVCDQNFCSSLTGTTPNRLYLWTGTVRPMPTPEAYAHVRNEDSDFFNWVDWTTYPERLEASGISWKIYQNEITLASGLTGEEEAWLSNYGDNPIEYFEQYGVRYAASYRKYCQQLLAELPGEIAAMEEKLKGMVPGSEEAKKIKHQLEDKETWLNHAKTDSLQFTEDAFNKLPERQRQIHQKAFSINDEDPAYRKLTGVRYKDGEIERDMKMPAGDVLYRFRQDVAKNQLPTVSWLVAPENFSDHPSSPWYGAWYISETLDILTSQPEVWKKTIFILCYDENDGYFDHVPPFTAPNPNDQRTGKVSMGIDARAEYVTIQQDMKRYDKDHARESSIGLGFRVPLVIASPWSRGGKVCSQVFDHTSILQFIEKFIGKKFGKQVPETNISSWRRAVCGDLTSVFDRFDEKTPPKSIYLNRNAFLEAINNARFKPDPSGYHSLSAEQIALINKGENPGGLMPRQEKGTRPACALPYELYADGRKSDDGRFTVHLRAGNELFGDHSAGSPFRLYMGKEKNYESRTYAVNPGESVSDELAIANPEGYDIKVYAPNGFFRQFTGDNSDPAFKISLSYTRDTTKQLPANALSIQVEATGSQPLPELRWNDHAYGAPQKSFGAGKKSLSFAVDLSANAGWYDFSIHAAGYPAYQQRFAGHVETGQISKTDPLMGGVVSGKNG